MKLDLTDRFCATIKTKKLVDYFDARTTGLGLRVSPTGVKAWSVMFTLPGTQKRARLSLGSYPATSLAKARTSAIEAQGKVEEGIDPRAVRADVGEAMVRSLSPCWPRLTSPNTRRKIKTGRELERRLRVTCFRSLEREACRSASPDVTRVLDTDS